MNGYLGVWSVCPRGGVRDVALSVSVAHMPCCGRVGCTRLALDLLSPLRLHCVGVTSDCVAWWYGWLYCPRAAQSTVCMSGAGVSGVSSLALIPVMSPPSHPTNCPCLCVPDSGGADGDCAVPHRHLGQGRRACGRGSGELHPVGRRPGLQEGPGAPQHTVR